MKSPCQASRDRVLSNNLAQKLLRSALNQAKHPTQSGAAEKVIQSIMGLPAFRRAELMLTLTPNELAILFEVAGRLERAGR